MLLSRFFKKSLRVNFHTLCCTVWKFASFCLKLFFAKNLEKFRENKAVKELFSKMVLEMAQFDKFRANLRKSDLFGLIGEGLD